MVSELGFGGIPIIRLGTDEAVGVVRHCFDRGVTFFDTANVYGDSERKIGQALESVRDRVVIATKTLMRDAETAADHIIYSLENLRTDRIDLYQIHNIANDETFERVLAPGGAYEALARARDEGKIRFIGLSSHNIATAIRACRTGKFDTLQFPFNFIECDPADELFGIAREMDMGIIAMKPLGGGLLERADLCFRFLQQHSHSRHSGNYRDRRDSGLVRITSCAHRCRPRRYRKDTVGARNEILPPVRVLYAV
jgi:aryl-alcohol dehydrogenase-like predicted oxidoreductase